MRSGRLDSPCRLTNRVEVHGAWDVNRESGPERLAPVKLERVVGRRPVQRAR